MQAALFFNKIVPMHSSQSVPEEVKEPLFIGTEISSMYLGPKQNDSQLLREFYELVVETSQLDIDEPLQEPERIPEETIRLLAPEMAAQCTPEAQRQQAIQTAYELRKVMTAHVRAGYRLQNKLAIPIIAGRKDSTAVDSLEAHESPTGIEVTLIAIHNMPLIDTSKAEWPQILEIRKDIECINLLRDMRLWYTKNLSDMTYEQVQDTIASLMEKAERAMKKHQDDLGRGIITSVVNSTELKVLAPIAFEAFRTGQSTVGTLTAAGSVLWEAAKYWVKRSQLRADFTYNQMHSEMAYIFEVNRRLKQ